MNLNRKTDNEKTSRSHFNEKPKKENSLLWMEATFGHYGNDARKKFDFNSTSSALRTQPNCHLKGKEERGKHQNLMVSM
jgi:hypothetical protein